MDIYKVLKKDHRTAKFLFSKLLKTSMKDKAREDIFEKLKTILTSHHEAEESVFYAALEREEDSSNHVENALEQHEEVVYSLEEIEAISLQEEDWHEKIRELQDYLLKHIKVEEGTIFKEAKRVFSEHQARELAQEFADAKKRAELELTSRYT